MFVQIAIGSSLLLISLMIGAIGFWLLESLLIRRRHWLARPPHRPKLILLLCLSGVGVLAQLTVSAWLWALTFSVLGIFATFEEALYFALVVFTTLGFGDILLPVEWRLLAGMASVNGLLFIGLVSAVMVEAMRQVRLMQQRGLS